MLSARKALSNIDPLPTETKAFIRRTIRFVPFSPTLVRLPADKSKGTKIQVIL